MNRSPESRGSQTSGVLPVLFVQAKRIKSFPFGKFEVLQTSNQRTKLQLRTNPIKSFRRSAAYPPPCGGFFFLLFVTQKGGIAPKEAARTHKKLPVASFCASETAETGRIANGREQGDHVSRRQRRRKSTRSVPSRQGHRREAAKGFNWACAKLLFCVLIRGLQNLETPGKGVRIVTFCIVQKVT